MQPVSSLCIFCRLSCMQGAKNVSRKRQQFLQHWLDIWGRGLFTGPYILTYVLYTIFLGVLGAYCRMGKEKGAEA